MSDASMQKAATQMIHERREAARKLRRHIAGCEECHGPHDGCEEGQELESHCIDELGFDPYLLQVLDTPRDPA